MTKDITCCLKPNANLVNGEIERMRELSTMSMLLSGIHYFKDKLVLKYELVLDYS